jgi:hypothetical protein
MGTAVAVGWRGIEQMVVSLSVTRSRRPRVTALRSAALGQPIDKTRKSMKGYHDGEVFEGSQGTALEGPITLPLGLGP